MALKGARTVLSLGDERYPAQLATISRPPECLYVIGSVEALQPGLAVIGARKATPYGIACASRFARIAAEKGVCIVSGGARGCDSEAHRAALDVQGKTVVVLGGGCDKLYPAAHAQLFQQVIDAGGAVISEHPWSVDPRPFYFRERNRIIAGLSEAVLIVEAGLPSGTFSTADDALDSGREVLVVPGAITSFSSRGSNRLLLQGAVPVVDDESFEDALFRTFGLLKYPDADTLDAEEAPLIAALRAECLRLDDLVPLAVALYGEEHARHELMAQIAEAEARGVIARHADGRWGPSLDEAGKHA